MRKPRGEKELLMHGKTAALVIFHHPIVGNVTSAQMVMNHNKKMHIRRTYI